MNQHSSQIVPGYDIQSWLAEYGFDVNDVSDVEISMDRTGAAMAVTTYRRDAAGNIIVLGFVQTTTARVALTSFPKLLEDSDAPG